MSIQASFRSHADAKASHWFSRRHQDNKAYYAQREDRRQRLAARAQRDELNRNAVAEGRVTVKQQIAKLNKRLGRNKGAVRERGRLAALLNPEVA